MPRISKYFALMFNYLIWRVFIIYAERITVALDKFVVQLNAMQSHKADLQISLLDVARKSKIKGGTSAEIISKCSVKKLIL